MAHDVFISHSSKDKAVADAVCATLESNNIRCWIAPRDILPGVDWGEAIVQAIGKSRVMILIFSSSANYSNHVKREVEVAVNKEVTILPFRIENILPSGAFEFHLSGQHWLDALTPPLESHLQRLTDNLKTLLEITTTSQNSLLKWSDPKWFEETLLKAEREAYPNEVVLVIRFEDHTDDYNSDLNMKFLRYEGVELGINEFFFDNQPLFTKETDVYGNSIRIITTPGMHTLKTFYEEDFQKERERSYELKLSTAGKYEVYIKDNPNHWSYEKDDLYIITLTQIASWN